MRTIAAKLGLSFGLMAALLIAGAALILHETKVSGANYEKLHSHTRGAVLLAQAQNALWQLRYGFPQFMVGDSAARTKIVADEGKWYKEIHAALDAYSHLDISEEERRALATLREAYKKYVDARPLWFGLYGSGKVQEAAEWRAKTTTPFGAATVANLNEQIELQQGASASTRDAISTRAVTLRNTVVAFVVLSLITVALIAFFLTRSIITPLRQLVTITEGVGNGDFTRRMTLDRRDELGTLSARINQMIEQLTVLISQVRNSGIQVSTSVTEIAATSKQQQATANEIAATTTQIGATSREISATSRDLVKTMNDVTTVAEGTAALATSGQTGLSHMEATMQHVMEAAGSINANLTVLNEKASNINQAVTAITKVADQTNLLSLNAAIEAEKAGEQGRGFSAVAAEIRRLADQTAVATLDIEQMVKEIQSAVSASVMGMDKFSEQARRGMSDVQGVGAQLSQIIQQVQALAPRIETVNEGMNAQATGAEQISEALLQLTEAAQQTVASLGESRTAIDELSLVSGNLRSGVTRFKLAA